jgi:hypothetical protein
MDKANPQVSYDPDEILVWDAMIIVGALIPGQVGSPNCTELGLRTLWSMRERGHGEKVTPRQLAEELYFFYSPYVPRRDHSSRIIRLLDRITRWVDPKA